MRILLSSLCAFVLFGCVSYPKKNGFEAIESIQRELLNPYFSDTSRDYVYKANIEAFDRAFGGLLILKKLGGDHHRILFTTEMGNTLFDFEFLGDDFQVNRILPEMDKKILRKILKRDFKALITEHPPESQTFDDGMDVVVETEILSKKHYFYLADGQLQKIVRTGNGKEKTIFLFTELNPGTAGKIQISHQTFPLKITLNQI
ncbi:MAG: hypothetical protein WA913_12725 [Pricia sp.]